jgi:RNA polymerase sigma-70 factor (ECF subfamily)
MNDTPEELCSRAREGDLTAASELVRRFHRQVYAYFRRHTGNDEESADLTQKTFFKVWVSIGSLRNDAGFPAWLHGIAHHVWVDWCRQRRPMDSRPDAWWEARDAGGPSPFEDAAERDLAVRLYRLVDQLRPEVRDTVHLHYYQGLSILETSEALEVATSTVKYRLREALSFLRGRMGEADGAAVPRVSVGRPATT